MTIEEALGVLDLVLQDSLSNTQELVFRYAWEGRTYEEIAEILGYVTDYIRSVGAQLWSLLSEAFGERVTKNNLQTVLRRWLQQRLPNSPPTNRILHNSHQDWGDAPDVFGFVGRNDELAKLEQWIVTDRCRLVALLGMGGIGKTSLAAVLAKRLQNQFDYVVWRSLRSAPSLDTLVSSLIEFLSAQQETETTLPVDENQRLLRLIHYLRQHRCLIILDNFETILSTATLTNFTSCVLDQLIDLPHQSCLILTSREKPDMIAWKEGTTLPIRSLQLRGLNSLESQAIFAPKGTFLATETEWQTLVQHYAGNPLALKMVAAAIEELFNSDIASFLTLLEQGTLVFDDIRDLLDRQFDRLSIEEKEIMYWIAIHREVVSFAELQHDLRLSSSKRKLPGTLKALRHRFLIEKTPTGFTQQPVVMEYLTERLIEQTYQEICAEELGLFINFALLKAEAKDYIRSSQKRLILEPIIERLKNIFRPVEIEQKFHQTLLKLQSQSQSQSGYAAGNIINFLRCLNLNLTGYDFSNLSVWQADFQNTNLHQVNFRNSDLARSIFVETLGNVWSVAFSPDGTVLAASDSSGEIHFWRVSDGKKLFTCKGHTHWVCTIVFADTQTLISGGSDHTIKLWDIHTGQCLKTLVGHTDWVIAVTFNASERVIASSGVDRTVRLWNIDTGKCLRTFEEQTHWVCTIAFSPNGKVLASGSDDRCIKLWETQTGQCLNTLEGHKSHVRAVTFNSTGEMLASGGDDCTIKLWDLATGHCITTLSGHSSPIRSLAFDSNENMLVSASEDHTLKLWDIVEPKCLKTLQGHTAHVRSVAFSPDGQMLASGSADQTVKLWHCDTGHCLRTLQGYTNLVLSIAFSPDGQVLASGSADHTIKLWKLTLSNSTNNVSNHNQPTVHPFTAHASAFIHSLKGHTDWVLSVAFSPDGHTLASGSFDQTIRLWDRYTGLCLKTLQGHANWIHSVAFSPNGQLLASASSDQTIQIWHVATGDRLKTLTGHHSHVWSVAFSPNGQFLASGGDASTVKLWNLEGKCLYTLRGHTHRVYSIAFSPDGKTLASSSVDQTVKLWDISHLAIGKEPTEMTCIYLNSAITNHSNPLSELSGSIGWVKSIAFSPDGKLLATGNTEPVVKLWNTATGQCLKVMKGHQSRIWSISFAPECTDYPNQVVATGSEDGTIRFWDTETGECFNTLSSPRPYEGMDITGITGVTEAQRIVLLSLGAIENPASDATYQVEDPQQPQKNLT